MYIASVSSTIKFHDFPNGNIVYNYQPGQIEGPIKSISWSRDGTWLLVVPYSGQTQIVCIKDQIKLLKTIHEIDEPSYACFQNTAKKYVGIGTKNGLALVYDIKSRNVKKRFTRLSTPITQIAFTSKDSHCIVGCKNGDVLMFNNVTNSPATNLRIPRSNSISCLKTSNLKRHLVMGGSVEGIVVVWDININRNKFFVQAHQAPINSLAFSPVNSELILTAGADRRICFFDTANGICIASVSVDNSITAVDFSPDGSYFVTASQNGRVFVYDSRNIQEPVHSFIAHNSAIDHIAFQNVQESNCSSMCSVSSTSLVPSVTSSENMAPRKSIRTSDFFHLSYLTDPQCTNEISQCSQDDSFLAALGLDKNSSVYTNNSVYFRDNKLPSIPDEPILEIENTKFEQADFVNKLYFSTPKFNCENNPSLNTNPPSTGLSDEAVDEIKSLIKECVSEEFKNAVNDLKEHIQYQSTHTTYQLRALLLDLHMSNVKEFIKLENFNSRLRDELMNTVDCVNNLLDENERLKNEVQFLKGQLKN